MLNLCPSLRHVVPETLLLGDFENAAARLAYYPGSEVSTMFAGVRGLKDSFGGSTERDAASSSFHSDWHRDSETRRNEHTCAVSTRAPLRTTLALLRLACCEVLELAAADEGRRAVPDVDRYPERASERAEATGIFQDAAALAVWVARFRTDSNREEPPRRRCRRVRACGTRALRYTSAHADFADARAGGFSEPAAPNIHSTPNMFSECDLIPFFERDPSCGRLTKMAARMSSLVRRAVSPVTRGWNATLAATLRECPGSRTICVRSLIASVCGMHAGLHPARRPNWRKRLIARKVMISALGSVSRNAGESESSFDGCATAVRETLRRSLAESMSLYNAKRDVSRRDSWTATLRVPPHDFPSDSLYSVAHEFARACEEIASGTPPTAALECRRLADATRPVPPRPRSFCDVRRDTVASLAKVLSERSFEDDFEPLWRFCHWNGVRLCRLGDSMLEVLRKRDCIRTAAESLSEEDTARVRALALGDASAALRSFEEVSKTLCESFRDTESSDFRRFRRARDPRTSATRTHTRTRAHAHTCTRTRYPGARTSSPKSSKTLRRDTPPDWRRSRGRPASPTGSCSWTSASPSERHTRPL
jgi:hypothetical protein